MQEQQADTIREEVRSRYAAAARAFAAGERGGCCAPDAGGCGCGGATPIGAALYRDQEAAAIPAEALAASLGCGSPTAWMDEVRPGESALDLGSGGGADVLLLARRLGEDGFVYGLDMTDEMLALAELNRRRAGARNVRFLKGTIESIPLPNASVDWIVSNCVINLSTDKPRVFAEAFRVLRPGGRLVVSDLVFLGEPPESVRRDAALWAGCVAGALTAENYQAGLEAAGFAEPRIDPISSAEAPGALISALIRARKPG
jgi:SAM-dependent methyltransferase